MNTVKVVDYDFNNGDGIAVTLWVAGCPHKCEGCHNPQLFNPNIGTNDIEGTIAKIKKGLSDTRVNKHLSILGGEPLAPYNIKGVVKVVREIRREFPDKEIWLWTGYQLDGLDAEQRKVLWCINYLIDGPFIKSKQVIGEWYGSSNQKIYELV